MHLILGTMIVAFVSYTIDPTVLFRAGIQRIFLVRIIYVSDSLLEGTIHLRTAVILEGRQVIFAIPHRWHIKFRMINTGVPHLNCFLKGTAIFD